MTTKNSMSEMKIREGSKLWSISESFCSDQNLSVPEKKNFWEKKAREEDSAPFGVSSAMRQPWLSIWRALTRTGPWGGGARAGEILSRSRVGENQCRWGGTGAQSQAKRKRKKRLVENHLMHCCSPRIAAHHLMLAAHNSHARPPAAQPLYVC